MEKENLFYSLNDGEILGISFDKIFEKPELSVYNEFNLKSKRNFKNITEEIIRCYNEIFLDKDGNFDDELSICLYNILNIKFHIMSENINYEKFIEMVDGILLGEDKLLVQYVSKHIEANYSLKLDAATEETKASKKKVNSGLQFTDEHAKKILKISYLYRLIIPLISEFFMFYKVTKNEEEVQLAEDEEDLEIENVNDEIFAHVFEHFAGDELKNKIYNLVNSRVAKTTYSDKRFWTVAKNVGITKDSTILDIYKRVLTNAIPKVSLDGDKNIISFLQSIINNQIEFLFQNKFKNRIIPVGSQNTVVYSDNEDDCSEYDKLELMMLRRDEGLYKLRKLNINKTMKNLPTILEIDVTDTEVNNLTKKLQRHPVQERIISMFSMKYFKDKQAIKSLSFFQYCKLVLLCQRYLQRYKFVFLPMILTANCEKHRERTTISGKKVRPLIEDSRKYDELFSNKFSSFSLEVEKPLSAIIGTTYSSIFKDDNGCELFDSSVKVAKIADELIDLAALV